jgi:hypothetical protein
MASVIPFPTRPLPTSDRQALTPCGVACTHLVRFERAWQMLSRDDRRRRAGLLGRPAAERFLSGLASQEPAERGSAAALPGAANADRGASRRAVPPARSERQATRPASVCS